MGLSDPLSGACNCGEQAINLPKEWELLGTEQGHSKGKYKPPGIVNTTSGWRQGLWMDSSLPVNCLTFRV